jgi:hypothetical protein
VRQLSGVTAPLLHTSSAPTVTTGLSGGVAAEAGPAADDTIPVAATTDTTKAAILRISLPFLDLDGFGRNRVREAAPRYVTR